MFAVAVEALQWPFRISPLREVRAPRLPASVPGARDAAPGLVPCGREPRAGTQVVMNMNGSAYENVVDSGVWMRVAECWKYVLHGK